MKLMNWLHEACRPMIESKAFNLIMSLVIFLNPVALTPQVYLAWTAPSVEGLSAFTWFLFMDIQAAIAFSGIKNKDASVFISMLISMMESIAILLAIGIR